MSDDIAGLQVQVDGGIATVTIDSPPINLFTIELFLGTAALIHRLAADPDVRVVVLRSANPEFFIAHFDVALILQLPTDLPEPTELNAFHAMCECFRTMSKATIAVIEGRVGGGGSELTLSCDMRFASLDRAVFNQPEVSLGIIPGGTGTQRLARLMGRSRALEAILGCDDVDAALAERWGWVNRALPDGELWPFVERLSRRIASFPPHAVAAAKASVLLAEKGLESDLLVEGALFNGTLKEPSARHAMERFLAGGGQTREGELRLGSLIEELGSA
jgi:enoyl-CoA hydratase/carnithine racemase